MAINFVIPVNIVFEIAMLAVQAYAYHYNKDFLYARIDQIYLGVGAVALLGSFIWLGYLNGKTKRFTPTVRSLRYVEAAALIITGSLMIYSAQDIQSERICDLLEQYFGECQKYVPKLAAGILAIVNGLVYFIRPCKTPAAPLHGFATNIHVQQYPQQPSYPAQPNEQSPVYGFQSQYYAAQPVPGTAPYPQTHGYMQPPAYGNETPVYFGFGSKNGNANAAAQQQGSNYDQPPAYYTNRAFQ